MNIPPHFKILQVTTNRQHGNNSSVVNTNTLIYHPIKCHQSIPHIPIPIIPTNHCIPRNHISVHHHIKHSPRHLNPPKAHVHGKQRVLHILIRTKPASQDPPVNHQP
ncbi:hypothetical protein BRARA_D00951 [Brassica rapa]|uniref:Uncharacterized protein n=1 Tax=Brassica campestris TaxID=3711 RepID=A0A397ZSX7_BRACM|nr:hypothetical protein BRARA_D00951 [Brassica rapa]